MFYEKELKTGATQPTSLLRIGDRMVPFAFGHVEGTAVSLVVNSNKGNEKSKANVEERKIVVWMWCDCLALGHEAGTGTGSKCQYSFFQVDIAQKLVETAKIKQQSIAILSPYNAQVSEIKENLKEKNMEQITVTTITKSQGDL